jgi:putative transposase
LNSIKREHFPWMLEVTKCAPQQAIMQLGDAFKNFFAGHAQYPRFHKKGINDSFALDNGQFNLNGSRIRLPHLGWVRIRETLRFTGKILSATISRTADRWFVAIVMDTDQTLTRPAENQGVVGVDLGVTTFATLSTRTRARPQGPSSGIETDRAAQPPPRAQGEILAQLA